MKIGPKIQALRLLIVGLSCDFIYMLRSKTENEQVNEKY